MSQLSDEVLKVSLQYLGPAAERFLERQTKSHLNGLAFTDLQKSHIPDLATWVRTSASLIIDKKKAEELATRITRMG
ncbi:hypothetical protein ABH15_10195 [Methanoculleus taiwanensis]|uniref:Uncharacterized protein n=1 Tax=Methanoculleus taiwanensis TaxID=1550565 RepID=A0A498H0I7_9EURY|nr:hypothetical protein [Methanoculleus taiwanensis]RXE56439.1 hypothetical protein ABH15_10195 [Methanoculleus taiwanensis]